MPLITDPSARPICVGFCLLFQLTTIKTSLPVSGLAISSIRSQKDKIDADAQLNDS